MTKVKAPKARVAICLPTYKTWEGWFGVDLVALVMCSMESRLIDVKRGGLSAFMVPTCRVDNNRNKLVEMALEENATHVLWLDTDMRFPADALLRLLLRKLPIVGSNARIRTPPHPFAAAKDGRRIATTELSTGVEPVDLLGPAVMLCETRVFRQIPQPWFHAPWEDGQHIGGDLYFCRKAKAAGFPPHVDHDLSKEVRHIGAFELSYTDRPVQMAHEGYR